MLYVPKVNEPIWGSLKGFHRQRDLRTAVLQDSIVRVTSALSITIDTLLGHVNLELSFKRRDSLRPLLNTDIKSACNRSNKPGTLLFGDDLTKTLNDSKLQGEILARDGRDQFTPKQRFAPYHFQKRQHFLPRRGRRGSYPPQQSPRQFRNQYKNQARH